MVAILSLNKPLDHTPVLTEEVIRLLAVQPGGRYLDCTVGGGGHAAAILEAASPGGLLLGLDADPIALEIAAQRLLPFGDSVKLVEANFRDLAQICQQRSFLPTHGVLFDLGVSSFQLADSERGFGIQVEAPLDMRFNPGQTLTATDIVNDYPEGSLADLIWRFGEEPASRRIARAILQARPLSTTTELAAAVARAVRGPRRRIHPATRTFQALRIAVNDELAALTAALDQAGQLLGRDGRLVVIAFHSLEDRIVKQFLQRESRDCICPPEAMRCTCGHRASMKILTKRTVRPTPSEVAANPRSRSARLRAAQKLPEGE